MRRTTRCLLVLMFVTVSAIQAADHWPPQVPQALDGWSATVSGSGEQPQVVEVANARIEYGLYSSPRHPLLFGISNYRIRPTHATGLFRQLGRPYHGCETVVTIDERTHRMSFFVRRRHGLLRRQRWIEILPNAPGAQAMEQAVVLRLWSVHALLTTHHVNPRTLTF